MKKITAYSVICRADYIEFIKMVNSSISEGWQPFGNLEIMKFDKTFFFQSVVQYEETPVVKHKD